MIVILLKIVLHRVMSGVDRVRVVNHIRQKYRLFFRFRKFKNTFYIYDKPTYKNIYDIYI